MTAPTPDEIAAAADLLEAVVEDRGLLAAADEELRKRLLVAAGRVSLPLRHERKKLARELERQRRDAKRARDMDKRLQTGIRVEREHPIFVTPEAGAPKRAVGELGLELEESRRCYVCKTHYTRLHHFYDQLCVDCGEISFHKRHPEADLSGRTALVTGARVKIGYHAAIMLLRSGCHVIVLTRFPRDAAARYAREKDFADWQGRLEIHGIDLRHSPSVETLCTELLGSHSRLDFIINNACQTVRRPPAFYGHLLDGETTSLHMLPAAEAGLIAGDHGPRKRNALPADYGDSGKAAMLSQVPLIPEDLGAGGELFPAGQLDADLQQVDLREVNSWRLMLDQVPTIELLEVHLVNAVAPFILNGRLRPLMRAVPTADKHIVNVSAMEGQFYRALKTARHPHTNMAKASLNMMTRTAASDYIEDGIHMNSVDTGWVTDEDPALHAARKAVEQAFSPPLDIVDGAARIVDPIYVGFQTGKHPWGVFFKDYEVTDW
ncbi:MAG: SDR family oxidoreductase [Deltaproteobacteria bacterium]|nr:SDR family oxidoreductase [Deltaproteobacteria bacterium]